MSITTVMSEEHNLILDVLEALEIETTRLEQGGNINIDFCRNFIDFVKVYADSFHHIKEEDILFKVVRKHEFTKDNIAVKDLLSQHNLGRTYIEQLKVAVENHNKSDYLINAKAYCDLMTRHIDLEDNVLFPLIEAALPEDIQEQIITDFVKSDEEKFPKKLKEKYFSVACSLRKQVGLKIKPKSSTSK